MSAQRKLETTHDAATLVQDLKTAQSDQRKTLEQITKKRGRFALKALQGDASAKAALAKLDEEETAAIAAARDIALAIPEAESDRRAAAEHDRAEADAARLARFADLSGQLIATDREVVAAVHLLHSHLEKRRETLQEIEGLRVLTPSNLNRLTGRVVAAALRDGLSEFLDDGRPNHDRGSLNRFVSHDGDVVGIEVERPSLSSVESAVERELRRLAEPMPWTDSVGAPRTAKRR